MNPFAMPLLCAVCNDTRRVTKRVEARENDLIPCPSCGNLNDDEYGRFRRDAWARTHKEPAICELDLSLGELATLRMWKVEHPHVSKLSFLSWIEGQRYDPAKDEDFLTEAREGFRKWRER